MIGQLSPSLAQNASSRSMSALAEIIGQNLSITLGGSVEKSVLFSSPTFFGAGRSAVPGRDLENATPAILPGAILASLGGSLHNHASGPITVVRFTASPFPTA